ncbi:hypothetical protein FCM35_KLT15668 [Carex littledalei]|uniref:Uncharacterized protein n=1 Tax=Carex littledalei TaxID=544730 RepID=A0A833VH10_9POAL|nr:hypothetical protein FCM35_KLT15668 [Carex littledalei]
MGEVPMKEKQEKKAIMPRRRKSRDLCFVTRGLFSRLHSNSWGAICAMPSRCSSVDWKPSAVLALASSFDGFQAAAVREYCEWKAQAGMCALPHSIGEDGTLDNSWTCQDLIYYFLAALSGEARIFVRVSLVPYNPNRLDDLVWSTGFCGIRIADTTTLNLTAAGSDNDTDLNL